MENHRRKGEFVKVGENLYRYSTSKTYYAVFRRHGKLRRISLKTADRELADRKLKTEMANAGKVDVRHEHLTLKQLVEMYEERLLGFDKGTEMIRRSVLNAFRRTWMQGLDVPVKDITPAQLEIWVNSNNRLIRIATLRMPGIVPRSASRKKWAGFRSSGGESEPKANTRSGRTPSSN